MQLERVERLGEEAWAGVAAVDRGEDDATGGLACEPHTAAQYFIVQHKTEHFALLVMLHPCSVF